MTLSIILWTAALAFFFGITNAIAYNRGNHAGYADDVMDGALAKVTEMKNGQYEVDIRKDGEE